MQRPGVPPPQRHLPPGLGHAPAPQAIDQPLTAFLGESISRDARDARWYYDAYLSEKGMPELLGRFDQVRARDRQGCLRKKDLMQGRTGVRMCCGLQ